MGPRLRGLGGTVDGSANGDKNSCTIQASFYGERGTTTLLVALVSTKRPCIVSRCKQSGLTKLMPS